jgi:accessory colonization factor AcfC
LATTEKNLKSFEKKSSKKLAMTTRKKLFEQRFSFKPTPSLYTRSKVLKTKPVAPENHKNLKNLKKLRNEKLKDLKAKQTTTLQNLQRSMTPRRILRQNASDYV